MLDKVDTRAIRRESTRSRVLQAAWELARRDGLAALTLRDVAARVGMRAPSLYSYFPSKNEMYDAMFAEAASSLAAELRGSSGNDAESRLRDRLRRFVGWCTADPTRYQLVFQRSVPGFAPSEESYQITVDALRATREAVEAAGIRGDKPFELLRGTFNGLTSLQIANDPGGNRWAVMADEALDMFLDRYAHQRRRARRGA